MYLKLARSRGRGTFRIIGFLPKVAGSGAVERPAVSAFANCGRAVALVRSSFVPCVDGSELARAFFRFVALVGAAMLCSGLSARFT